MNQTWSVAAEGRARRKSHRLTEDGRSICGLVDGVKVFVDAEGVWTRCGACLKGFLDLEEGLRNYTVDESGCWLWGGYRDKNSYGRIPLRDLGTIQWVHRVSYEFHVRPIEPGYEIDHVCMNPPCMNPAHLEQVTKPEHARRTHDRLGSADSQVLASELRRLKMTYKEIAEAMDLASLASAKYKVDTAIKRGFVDADELPKTNRLTEHDREDIRSMYLFGIPQTAIARFYEMDNSQISRICNGKSSGHGTGEAA